MLDQIRLDLALAVDVLAMLGRDDESLELDGPLLAPRVDLVADGVLRLAFGAEVGQDTVLAGGCERLRDLVRERDRQGHQLRRLVARVAHHEALVARTGQVERVVVAGIVLHLEGGVDAAGDVGRLLVERHDDRAGLGVEAELRARVPDRGDPLAHQTRNVDVGARRHLAGHDDEPGRDERLAGDPPVGVVGEHGVQHRVGDLVGDLVRMTLGDRLGGDAERPGGDARNPSGWRAGCSAATRRWARGPSGSPPARPAGGPRAPSRRSP